MKTRASPRAKPTRNPLVFLPMHAADSLATKGGVRALETEEKVAESAFPFERDVYVL